MGLKSGGGTFEWYIAVLESPAGEQVWYFRPGPASFTVPFVDERPGEYVGGLYVTVDNQKGPGKFVRLSTRCTKEVI